MDVSCNGCVLCVVQMIRNIAARAAPKVVRRAEQWDEVTLRAVPLQADEQEGGIEVSGGADVHPGLRMGLCRLCPLGEGGR